MSSIGQPERATQDRVLALLRGELGYRYLGHWMERAGNSNIEDELLGDHLGRCGYSAVQTAKAIYALHAAADHSGRSLYDNNQAVYQLLRYGVQVKAEAGDNFETVQLIDWHEPARNDFAVAQEVTLRGQHERRPDIVLYLNGIAVGVLELKNTAGAPPVRWSTPSTTRCGRWGISELFLIFCKSENPLSLLRA